MSFNSKYAKYYDAIYQDKDYKAECDFLEQVCNKFARFSPRLILDVGCGTGGHLIELRKRGYLVDGIDASSDMVSIAKSKITGERKLVFNAEIKHFEVHLKYDTIISMFAVINYITDTEELIKAFKNIRKHLLVGGLFIADFWYGPAVLKIRPEKRDKQIDSEKGNLSIFRSVVPEIDTFNNIVRTHYSVVVHDGEEILDDFEETHTLRYLFPQELEYYLSQSGLRLITFCEFMNLENPPSDDTWNVTLVAEAV